MKKGYHFHDILSQSAFYFYPRYTLLHIRSMSLIFSDSPDSFDSQFRLYDVSFAPSFAGVIRKAVQFFYDFAEIFFYQFVFQRIP